MHYLEVVQQKTKHPLRIGILGCRGIPNHYGGYEQFAQYLSQGLVERGHRVFVYQSSLHPFKAPEWNQVELIQKWDPENLLGSFGQFVYDFLSILDARKRDLHVLFQLGYTSNAVFSPIWPKHCPNFIHMDGLEWKRSKYHPLIRKFLKLMERVAVENGDCLIADSVEIRKHLEGAYRKAAVYIPYGAFIPEGYDEKILAAFQLAPYAYHLAIARFVPENNLELIIRGYLAGESEHPLVLIGNCDNKYGSYLKRKYPSPSVIFPGAIFDNTVLDNLRHFCKLYFHGHSVGGTNPSLLEAMACGCTIAAHDNPFNYAILGQHAEYFSDESAIRSIIQKPWDQELRTKRRKALQALIQQQYRWDQIIDQYEHVFLEFAQEKKLQFGH